MYAYLDGWPLLQQNHSVYAFVFICLSSDRSHTPHTVPWLTPPLWFACAGFSAVVLLALLMARFLPSPSKIQFCFLFVSLSGCDRGARYGLTVPSSPNRRRSRGSESGCLKQAAEQALCCSTKLIFTILCSRRLDGESLMGTPTTTTTTKATPIGGT